MVRAQIHLYFAGYVQGVGFRFITEDLARTLSVVGWVKNLHDGRVEVVAEAEEETLREFLSRLRQKFSQYIQNVDIDWLPPTGEFQGFNIRF
ncbi:MAG: acylphosphatase [Candidatus Omnitrophica bacterium]|nr:acylphosphatase [Candidatus Omnitrophota bacterium]